MKAIMIILVLVTNYHGSSIESIKVEFDTVAICDRVLSHTVDDIKRNSPKASEYNSVHILSARCTPI